MRRNRLASTFIALLTLAELSPGAVYAKTYMAFGDSITKGDAKPEFDIDFDATGNGYPARLEDLLRAAGNKQDRVRNEGIPGETTDGALTSISFALNRGGDTMLLMLGTNDVTAIAQGAWSVETVKQNLDSLRSKAQARGMPTIMATTIPRLPRSPRDPFNTTTLAVVKATRALQAQNGRSLADPWEAFIRIPEKQRYNEYYFTKNFNIDKIGHPNDAGFQLIAETFKDVILEIDRLEPLPGPFSLPAGTEEISKNQDFKLVLYDHLSGIDRKETFFLVNGKVAEDASITSTGDRKKATLTLELSKFKDCKLRLEVLAQDRADPPNILDLHIKDYRIKGRGFKRGDVDFDCRVDGVDLVLFAFHFGASLGDARYDTAADFDNNNDIDGEDLAILMKNFGKTAK